MGFLSIIKRRRYIIPMVAVLLIVIGFVVQKVSTRQSPEYTANVGQIQRVIALGWPLKHFAVVEENREIILEFRKELAEYYGNQEQELTKQQRLVTVALDQEVARDVLPEIYTKYYADDDVNIIGFNVSEFKFEDARINKDRATIKGEVEYFIKRRMLAQEYGTKGSNMFEWQLVKTKGKWLIVKETMLLKDE